MNPNDTHGFTLVEVLLSVIILAMMAGISLPVYQSFQNRNELDVLTQHFTSALRRAQTYTRGVSGDSQWGVAIQSGTLTLFKGASFATRDTTYDETAAVPASINVSGDSEVVFAKLTGYPDASGSTTFTNVNNDTRTVSINAKGMVSY